MSQSHRLKFLQDEISNKANSRIVNIQMNRSLNRVPYPMIFMKDQASFNKNNEENNQYLK